MTSLSSSSANSQEIDVNYLQTCLKEEDSTLDVLVLMDSSRSLRDATSEEAKTRNVDQGSDPGQKRGPILESSLKLLRTLADESDRELRISLRNFGNNEPGSSNKEGIEKLKEKWIDWTDDTSDQKIDQFVENALYDDSPGTQWANGLKTAREAFNKRFSDPGLEGRKSCPIMFWITDGAPDNPSAEKSRICQRSNEASIEWFRERNILVLGGLLRPLKGSTEDASLFGPIVTGTNCGSNLDAWTRGSVIEADDINALAWEFVGLIAKIKNLMKLESENKAVVVDPETRVLEVFFKGNPNDWQINAPDGSTFCSKSQLGGRCVPDNSSEIGILTVRIVSKDSPLPSGRWTVVGPSLTEGSVKFYGGVNGKLIVSPNDPAGLQLEEDEEAKFEIALKSPNNSVFDISGYESLEICGFIASTQKTVCKSGSALTELALIPGSTDKNISFEATLTSARDPERKYRFFQTVKINVQESNKYPSLQCEEKTEDSDCKFKDVPNKAKEAMSTLKIAEAKLGSSGGKVFFVEPTITFDEVVERGNEKFNFRLEGPNGEEIQWGNRSQLLSPGDEVKLYVSTEIGGKSKIRGNLKYGVVQDGQEVVRQLDFEFGFAEKRNLPLLIALIVFAYLLTVGIPYLYLLWSAKRSAYLTIPDDQIAYYISPIKITSEGRLVSVLEQGVDSSLQVPPQKGLTKQEIQTGTRTVEVGPAQIEVIPPKWNPFVEPRTILTIPNNHVLSTCGEKSLQPNQATFSSSLVGEGVVYFDTETNLSPVIQTQVEKSNEENQVSVFTSIYEEKIKEEPIKRSGEVNGYVLFIIPFISSYKKMLQEVTSKVISAGDGANLREHIEELRAQELESLKARIEAEKAAAESEISKAAKKDKKSSKKGGNPSENKEVTEEGMDSNPFFDNNQKKPDVWGNDGDDFSGGDGKGPSIWG